MIAKLTFGAFIAFWSAVVTIIALAALASDDRVDDGAGLPRISAAELAEHATADTCWMAIEGRVYDFTDYIPEHPTRPAVMLRWCGREATEGMRTKGFGRDHSPAAWAMMEDYLIGTYAGEE